MRILAVQRPITHVDLTLIDMSGKSRSLFEANENLRGVQATTSDLLEGEVGSSLIPLSCCTAAATFGGKLELSKTFEVA